MATRARPLMPRLRRIKMAGWTSRISAGAYGKGVSACLENARGLLEESSLLFDAGHHARATALAILAVEEGDKVRRLLMLCLADGNLAREWEDFRNHGPKLSAAFSLFTHGKFSHLRTSWAQLRPKAGAPEWFRDLPHYAGRVKERMLYVDLLKDGSWSSPSRALPPLVCEGIILFCQMAVGVTTTFALGIDLVLHGQLEPGELQLPVMEPASMTPQARRWFKWRSGAAGQRWGSRELARQMEWAERLAKMSPKTRRRPMGANAG